MTVVNKQTVMPEFITREDMEPQTWRIQEGAPVRGDAWTDMRAGQMRVPMGDDELSRIVRVHELTHAKVSPTQRSVLEALPYDVDTLVSAEEFRVNSIVGHLGFNINALRDGSEKFSGEMCGKSGNWNSLVRFVASTAGTKACEDFIKGLNKTNSEFAIKARKIHKQLLQMRTRLFNGYEARHVASTELTKWNPDEYDIEIPLGFSLFTLPIAKFLNDCLLHDSTEGTGDIPVPGENTSAPDIESAVRGRIGHWAKPIEKFVPKPRFVDGKLGRKRIATNIGQNPRRINRMLMDPEKRIFDRRAKGKGGVVLIDQSGSMHLSEEAIWTLIESAPGCTIIGYSHQSSSTTVPNIWVIAEKGKVADHIPDGNGGNGVDGPALYFALAKRKKGEPFVWVCDGVVTDGIADKAYPNLEEECAKIVNKHEIHMTSNMAGAIKAFQKVARGGRLNKRFSGPIAYRAELLGYEVLS